MGEVLSIGGYVLDPDAAWFEIHRYGLLSGLKKLIKVRNVWTIHGRVNGTPESGGVDGKVVALENSVKDGIDIVFSLGSTMRLLSGEMTEGTHIKEFSWLGGTDGVRGSGAEGVLRRTFRLVVYGDVLVTGGTDLTGWQESLTFVGTGLGKVVPVGSLTGTVQAQQVQAYTPYYMIQSGFATGLTDYPVPPTPIYQSYPGVFYMPDGYSTSKMTPREWGLNQNTGFGVRWSYKCWSAFGLMGNPTFYL